MNLDWFEDIKSTSLLDFRRKIKSEKTFAFFYGSMIKLIKVMLI